MLEAWEIVLGACVKLLRFEAYVSRLKSVMQYFFLLLSMYLNIFICIHFLLSFCLGRVPLVGRWKINYATTLSFVRNKLHL